MTRRLLAVVAWLLGGEVLAGGLYWAFLNTPESNVVMLVTSALLGTATLVTFALTVGVAALWIDRGAWTPRLLPQGARLVPWFVLSFVPAMLLWWLTKRVDGWIAAGSGEISAWVIARFGWADVSVLLTCAAWLLVWVRSVAGPVISLALFLTVAGRSRALLRDQDDAPFHEAHVTARPRLAGALHWRSLGRATLWFLLLIALPWHFVASRPTGINATWIEPAVAAGRLLVVVLATTIGLALMIREATGRPSATRALSARTPA